MLTRRSKYGLKAVLYLAGQVGRGPVSVAEIADKEGLPRKFLEAILLDLNRHGLVQSKKGKGGGYFLRRSPSEITFGDAVRALEGPLALVPCVSQTAYQRCADCLDEETCGVRLAMGEVRDATARILDRMTLADMSGRVRRRRRRQRSRNE